MALWVVDLLTMIGLTCFPFFSVILTFGAKYSRIDQINFVEGSL